MIWAKCTQRDERSSEFDRRRWIEFLIRCLRRNDPAVERFDQDPLKTINRRRPVVSRVFLSGGRGGSLLRNGRCGLYAGRSLRAEQTRGHDQKY